MEIEGFLYRKSITGNAFRTGSVTGNASAAKRAPSHIAPAKYSVTTFGVSASLRRR